MRSGQWSHLFFFILKSAARRGQKIKIECGGEHLIFKPGSPARLIGMIWLMYNGGALAYLSIAEFGSTIAFGQCSAIQNISDHDGSNGSTLGFGGRRG